MWLVATNCHSSFRGMNLKVWGILLADLITGSQIKKKKKKKMKMRFGGLSQRQKDDKLNIGSAHRLLY